MRFLVLGGGGMLGETRKLRVRADLREDLSVPCRDRPPALPLQGTRHNRCTAALAATLHHPIDELHKLIGETHSNLLAHP